MNLVDTEWKQKMIFKHFQCWMSVQTGQLTPISVPGQSKILAPNTFWNVESLALLVKSAVWDFLCPIRHFHINTHLVQIHKELFGG